MDTSGLAPFVVALLLVVQTLFGVPVLGGGGAASSEGGPDGAAADGVVADDGSAPDAGVALDVAADPQPGMAGAAAPDGAPVAFEPASCTLTADRTLFTVGEDATAALTLTVRDAALVAAQNEVIAAQDRYDSHDVTRVVRKLDILAQAESIRSSGMFILPAMTAGAVALERYNLWKKHQGTLSTSAIPMVENAPASPLVTNEVTPKS